MFNQKRIKLLTSIIVIIIIFIIGSILTSPKYSEIHTDSGYYLYYGQEILEGKTIYRDFYDLKPPVTFYINALGLLLGIGHLGVWLLESLFLLAALIYFTVTVSKFFGAFTGFFSGITASVLLRYPAILNGGNVTEIYGVGIIIFLLSYLINNEKSKIKWIIIGILSVIVFLTKQSLSAIIIVLFVWLVINSYKNKEYSFKLMYFILGVILTSLSVFLLLLFSNLLYDFWDVNFIYPLAYTKITDLSFFDKFNLLFKNLFKYNLINFIIISICSSIIIFFSKYKNNNLLKLLSFIIILGVPLDLYLISTPGTFTNHYFNSLTPFITIGILIFSFLFFNHVINKINKKPLKIIIAISIFLVVGLLYPVKNIIDEYNRTINFKPPRLFETINEKKIEEDGITKYLETIPEKYDIFLWGSEMKYYFLLKRSTPIRFHTLTMLTEGYFNDEKLREVMDILENDPPEIIIDTSYDKTIVGPLSANDRNAYNYIEGYNWQGLEPFYRYIEENYLLSDFEVPFRESGKWKIYILRSINSSSMD